ncbi:hypothetical protein Meth11DRAFT_2127 [Methylophilaceae bacterium 11]|nr:hypothetical protein Meth11DRAFT_2127 [Methylophilaceae bacterium 11]
MCLPSNIILLVLTLFSATLQAQSTADFDKPDNTRFDEATKQAPIPAAKIEKILRTYAETIGCDFSMSRKNIVEIDIDQDEFQEKEFVALFNIDVGCAGGSGTGKSSIAVLKYRDVFHKDMIYILPELSEPSIASYGLPKFIDRLYIKNGQLWCSGKIHKHGDANNLPTSIVYSQLKLIKKEIPINAHQTTSVLYWQSNMNYGVDTN